MNRIEQDLAARLLVIRITACIAGAALLALVGLLFTGWRG